MKALILLTILIASLVSAQDNYQCNRQSYERFKTTFNKDYSALSNQDKEAKYQKFCQTLQMIDSLNGAGLSETFGVTQFADFLEKQQKQMFTVRRPVGAGQEMEYVSASASEGELKRVGAPPNWRSKASAIKNQGQCGACWAFTTVGLYESWMKFKGQQEYDLSEEFILECTNSLHANNYTSDCTGGYTDFALQVAKNYGIPTETAWPYKAAAYGSVRGAPSSPGICSTNQSFVKYNSLPGAKDPLNVTRYDNRTVNQIEVLLESGPLGAMMYVDSTFQAYRGGIYTLCPNFTQAFNGINHAVVIVGMDADKNYIIKNSWGTAWGDSGFATVSSANDCALSAYVFKLSWGYQLVGSSLLFLLGLLVLFA